MFVWLRPYLLVASSNLYSNVYLYDHIWNEKRSKYFILPLSLGSYPCVAHSEAIRPLFVFCYVFIYYSTFSKM